MRLCKPALAAAAGSHSYSQMLDGCCELLHGMSTQPAVTAVLQADVQLRLELTQLLHRVLHRCVCAACWSPCLLGCLHAAKLQLQA